MKEYKYIDLLKIMAMFGVILYHCFLPYSNNPFWLVNADTSTNFHIYINNILDLTNVPIFIFCSGFLFQNSLNTKKESSFDMLKKRSKRLLLPYFLFEIFWLVPLYTILNIPTFGRETGSGFIKGYQAAAMGRFTDTAWFFLILYWTTVLWILLKKLLEKKYIYLGFLTAIISYLLAHFFLKDLDFYKLSQVDVNILIFFFGTVFYYVTDFIISKFSTVILLTVSIIGIITTSFFAQYANQYYILFCILKILIPIFYLVLAIGINKLSFTDNIYKSPIFKWLNANKLLIFLFQTPAMYLNFWAFYPLLHGHEIICSLIVFLTTVIEDLIIVSIYNLLKKYTFDKIY